jgi:GTP-binding protein LepA
MDPRFVRNFSIIAHIDHGKSTLADRFLEITGALQPREMESQVLDSMDLERERGITIKAHAVRWPTRPPTARSTCSTSSTRRATWISRTRSRDRSRRAKARLLLVDASQGVEAQTLANAYLAVENNLEIIPVINKIDLPGAQPTKSAGRSRRSSASTRAAPSSRARRRAAASGILEAIVHACRRRRAIPTRR